MKFLPPIILKTQYYTDIEKAINELFDEIFYNPIREVFKKYKVRLEYENAKNDDLLTQFLWEGLISYYDGGFHGKFNSTISRTLKFYGATFDKKTSSWLLDKNKLPEFLLTTLAGVENRNNNLITDVLNVISQAQSKIEPALKQAELFPKYEKTSFRINAEFDKLVDKVAIVPKFTQGQEKVIAEQYTNNMNLYIQNWSQENIIKLRQNILESTMTGKRSENLINSIVSNYNVSRNKAKFLARQETSLLMSKIREERFKLMGVRKYKWSGAMDQRERKDHKELQGKIFAWDNPPIIDKKTGRRANPGEDFGCRCIAIPIIDELN
jgi:SPP1 gp7 family putative phage head morphogenesis protein